MLLIAHVGFAEVQGLECALNTSVDFLVDNWGLIDGKVEGSAVSIFLFTLQPFHPLFNPHSLLKVKNP